MTKADIWMPLYIGDYLADTSRLTTEQHGAYLLLMMDYWRNGAPPDDDEILQNIVRLSKFLWKKHRPILEKFFTVKDGVWTHKRIEEEMTEALSSKEVATERGKKGAEARWGKIDASSIPQALPNTCPSPSPSSLPIKSLKNKASAPRSPSVAKPESVSDLVWTDFIALRKSKKAPLTETALSGIENEAAKAGFSLEDALKECCARGWQAFKADWVRPSMTLSGTSGATMNKQEALEARNRAIAQELAREHSHASH